MLVKNPRGRGAGLQTSAFSGLLLQGGLPRLRGAALALMDDRPRRRHKASQRRVVGCGVGIRPEHLPHVFERFYPMDKARSRADGGSALGLSMVESMVAAHGERVDVPSTPAREQRSS